ncbi:hypothetical protein [Nocardia aurantia]|nr:hypothetical protein [Nocardia aurantia]
MEYTVLRPAAAARTADPVRIATFAQHAEVAGSESRVAIAHHG